MFDIICTHYLFGNVSLKNKPIKNKANLSEPCPLCGGALWLIDGDIVCGHCQTHFT
jgi:hypothetical protein